MKMSDQKNDDEFVERRERGRLIHRFQRKTDPSIWLPGSITIIISAAILWAASELNTVHKLNQDLKEIVAWKADVAEWQDQVELIINTLELEVSQLKSTPPGYQRNMKSTYLVSANHAENMD